MKASSFAPLAPWRWFTWLYNNHPRQTVAAIALLVVASAAATGYTNISLGRANAQNAVTQCENANESRQASRTLWFFVVDLAGRDASPVEAVYLGEVRAWIGKVYQSHDCGDLSRKYPLPDPPSLPAA